MRPVLRRAPLAAACLSALVLAGCGKHVDSNAPITFAPADTPYLFANFKSTPKQAIQAWIPSQRTRLTAQIQEFASLAKRIGPEDPHLAAVLNAIHAELANVQTIDELTKATGFSWPALYAVYGIGDVPVMRVELASADTFKAFWARVEKHAGITTPSAKLDRKRQPRSSTAAAPTMV